LCPNYLSYTLNFSGVEIRLVESTYTINEASDTDLGICVQLIDGILERNVTVMLNTLDGTATTMGKP